MPLRRTLLLLVVATWSIHGARATERPNVILVMCDDLGYGDPRCFNPKSPIETPHLDAMAANGVRFTRFYAAAPVCSPTRGSCLTGRHPYRYGVYSANTGHLRDGEIALPEILKEHGYTTGHFGKWHLGTLTTTIKDANRGGPRGKKHFSPPSQHAYDTSLVTESKVPTYDPMIRPPNATKFGWDALEAGSESVAYGTRYWDHAGNIETKNLRGDDSRVIMDRAIPFIEGAVDQGRPFLAVIWFHAPHLPVVAGPEHVKSYRDHPVYERNYYGCVTALDEQVGRLRARLRDLEIADDTMLWFCSDNGPEGTKEKAPGSAGEFRGRKRSLYEGGVRVPGILEWPSRIQPRVVDTAAVTSDFLPTTLEVMGIEYPDQRPLDGTSLWSVILGESSGRGSPIGFQSANQLAWHRENMKLYSGDKGKTWELYDLSVDPSETTNLADTQPEMTRILVSQLQAWRQSCARSDRGDDY